MRRGEIWWADLGAHRPMQQTGRRPVIVWQSNALTSVLASVLVVPLTTNLDRANLAGTAVTRAVPKAALRTLVRVLTDAELGELELATDEALGRVEPDR